MTKKPNIIIASGLFPADIGGPATIASLLSRELPKSGCEVTVVTYGTKKQLDLCVLENGCNVLVVNKEKHILRRYFGFFKAVWKLSKEAKIIYAFDLVSVGIPCAFVKFLKPKTKLVVRLGGDYQWEKAVQFRNYDKPLEKYYEDKNFSLKEKFDYYLTNKVLGLADKVVFNSDFLRDVFVRLRDMDPQKAVVIKNIIPDTSNIEQKERKGDKVRLLFAGRIIKVRNLKRFIDAFSDIKKGVYAKDVVFEILGSGPEKEMIKRYVHDSAMDSMISVKDGLPRDELLKKIGASDVIVLPSLTDINPNFVIEALMLRKHIIITKHTESYFTGVRNIFLNYIDPLDANDISRTLNAVIERIKDKKVYDIELASIDITKIGWPLLQVIDKHIKTFEDLI